MSDLKPTTDFRWALIPKGEMSAAHPSALDRGRHALVLQQRWTSVWVEGASNEWRDIPMIEVSE